MDVLVFIYHYNTFGHYIFDMHIGTSCCLLDSTDYIRFCDYSHQFVIVHYWNATDFFFLVIMSAALEASSVCSIFIRWLVIISPAVTMDTSLTFLFS